MSLCSRIATIAVAVAGLMTSAVAISGPAAAAGRVHCSSQSFEIVQNERYIHSPELWDWRLSYRTTLQCDDPRYDGAVVLVEQLSRISIGSTQNDGGIQLRGRGIIGLQNEAGTDVMRFKTVVGGGGPCDGDQCPIEIETRGAGEHGAKISTRARCTWPLCGDGVFAGIVTEIGFP